MNQLLIQENLRLKNELEESRRLEEEARCNVEILLAEADTRIGNLNQEFEDKEQRLQEERNELQKTLRSCTDELNKLRLFNNIDKELKGRIDEDSPGVNLEVSSFIDKLQRENGILHDKLGSYSKVFSSILSIQSILLCSP